MGQLVVGLDVGSYSMKAAILATQWKGWELVDFKEMLVDRQGYVEAEAMIEETINPDEEPEQHEETATDESESTSVEPGEAVNGFSLPGESAHRRWLKTQLERMFTRYGQDWEQLITGFDGDALSVKILEVPFTDPHQIEMILPGLLEDVCPFKLDGKHIDYQIVEQGEKGEPNKLLTGIVDEEPMAQYLEIYQDLNKEPRHVTIDSLALGNVFPLALDEEARQGVHVVVDFGHRKTNLALFRNGNLLAVRTIRFGGQDLTQALASSLHVPVERAESMKHAYGVLPLAEGIGLPADASHPEVGDVLREAIGPWLVQMRLSLHSFSAMIHETPQACWITGGSSRLGNLSAFITESLNLPTQRLHWRSPEIPVAASLPEMPEASSVPALGLALNGVSARRTKRLNFRKGAFAFKGDFAIYTGNFVQLAIGFAAIAVCFLFNVWSQFQVLGAEEEQVRDQISAICKQTLNADITNPRICQSTMLEVIEKAGGGIGEVIPKPSTLQVYDEIVYRITGEGVDINLVEMDIGEKSKIGERKVKLQGEVDAIPTVGTIKEKLEAWPCIHTITQGPTRPSVRGNRVEFSMNLVIDCSKAKPAETAAEAKPDEPGTTADGEAPAQAAPANGEIPPAAAPTTGGTP